MGVKRFIWDELSDNVILETDESDTVTAQYTNRPEQFGELLSQDRSGTTHYFHFDGQHSTRDLTDSNENVTDRFIYTAYGEEVARTGATTNPFGYKGAVGYYTNSDTSDIYVRARTYQPTIGRWLSMDPLGFVDGTSLYRAYFVPGAADPSGWLSLIQDGVTRWEQEIFPEFQCDPCRHSVDLQSACLPETAPEGIPWSRAELSPPPGFVYGETGNRRTLDCKKCIKCPDGRFKLRGPCTATIEFHFLFDLIAILNSKRIFQTLYGHEQRHVINLKKCFKGVVASDEVQAIVNRTWGSKEICEETAPFAVLSTIKFQMQPCFRREYTHDNNNPNYVPARGKPYEPIGPVPGNPVPVPGWIPKPNWWQ